MVLSFYDSHIRRLIDMIVMGKGFLSLFEHINFHLMIAYSSHISA